MPDATLPGSIVTGRLEALPWLAAVYSGPAFPRPPDLLVIHSAASGDNPAAYLHAMPDGRKASAHISATGRDGGFVQQVLLNLQAWHAGGSTFQGRGGVNARSLGVELPAHAGPGLRAAWDALLTLLLPAVPSLRYYSTHRWVRSTKRDPVCLTDDEVREWMAGTGLDGR